MSDKGQVACIGLFALGLGPCAGFAALAARRKLLDPTSAPGWFPEAGPEELRLIVLLCGGMGAFCALLLLGALRAWGEPNGGARAAIRVGRRRPSIAVSPSFLLRGAVGPFDWVDPEEAATATGGCLALLAGLATVLLATWWWWPLPDWSYFAAGLMGAVGLAWVGWAGRSYLAGRRLRLRLLEAPRRIELGSTFELTGQLLARSAVTVDRLRVVVARVEEWTTRSVVRSGGGGRTSERTTHREVLGQHVQDLETQLRLEPGQAKRFRTRVKAPREGWREPRPEARSCWLLGVVAEIPGWPDYELIHELEVEMGSDRS